jgi:amidophosphoribosyltransferase
LALDTDTEIMMHEISNEFPGDNRPSLIEMMREVSKRFDGAYSLVFLNAKGDMLVARDPLGIKPLCYAKEGPLFAAASESVALLNLGFAPESIKSLPPGHAITICDGKFKVEQYAETCGRSHCYFEWIYFANVASSLDEKGVYLSRTKLGQELAEIEKREATGPLNDGNTIVVPVPDTSKAAADAMAYALGIPSMEGLIRNRYAGRTFIEGGANRKDSAATKYTPLREVLEGKRVFLVEDSIVRSTTMRALLDRIRELGRVKELHIRVACPPIIAPCYYGIDMSTIRELFAPKFMDGQPLTAEIQQKMADDLGANSLRYLPVEAIARAIGFPSNELCQACITGKYPTPEGQRRYQWALENPDKEKRFGRGPCGPGAR